MFCASSAARGKLGPGTAATPPFGLSRLGKIDEFASNEKIRARAFPYDAQIYLLMLGQLLHLFSLNELVDVSQIYASELSRIRGIVPAKLNTFSNANRTRNPDVIEKFFWHGYGMMAEKDPKFVAGTRKSALAKFRSRGIYAIGILDRAYNAFPALYRHHRRGGFFVVREKDFLSVLRAYGIAPGGNTGESHDNMPYLRGFENYFAESAG